MRAKQLRKHLHKYAWPVPTPPGPGTCDCRKEAGSVCCVMAAEGVGFVFTAACCARTTEAGMETANNSKLMSFVSFSSDLRKKMYYFNTTTSVCRKRLSLDSPIAFGLALESVGEGWFPS